MNLISSSFITSVLTILLAGLLPAQDQSSASGKTDAPTKDLYSMDLKSLLDLKVITASKFPEKLSEAPGIISVVTKDEIRRFGAITLREVLDRVPGLTGTAAYMTDRSMVAARGDQTRIDGGHILILINGRPTREILEGGVISDVLESFPVDILERIEVIKGPGSVLYGSNAFSGVINLITQKAQGTGLTVKGSPGTGGAQAGSAQAMFQHGDWSIVGAAQFHQAPGWNAAYDYLDPASGRVSLSNASVRDRGPGAYLGLNYKGLSLMSSFMSWYGTSFVWGTIGQPRWKRGFADLGYRYQASERWDMTFNLTYTRTTFDLPEFPSVQRDSNEVVAEWTNLIRPTDKDQLTVGVLYNHIQGRELFTAVSPSVPVSDGGRPGGAFYGQLDHRLLDRLKVIGGLQANKIGDLALNLSPRVGIIWDPAPRFTVKGLYSKAFRAPSINEQILNYPFLTGNPNLKPEKVGTLDIGLTYSGSRIQAGVSYFYSTHTDAIVIYPSMPRMEYVNLGETTFHGAEMEGKYRVGKHFLLLGSLLYQANRDEKRRPSVTPIANFGIKAGISYEVENGWTASLFDIYEGPLNARYAGLVNPSPSSYHLVNAHVRYDLSKRLGLDSRKRLALYVHADNVANQEAWLPALGDLSPDTMPMYRGRTIYFGVEIGLKKE